MNSPTIVVNGVSISVPALSLKNLKNGGMALLKETDNLAVDPKNHYEAMAPRAALILMAVQQVAPTVTAEQLDEALDLGNTIPLWLQVLGASGLRNQNMGEDQKEAPTLAG